MNISELFNNLKLRAGILKKNFDNRIYWNRRYTVDMSKGSGIGSRGSILEYKRKILKDIVDDSKPASILDIGCGDMEVSSILPSTGYTGMDISDIIIERNKSIYPSRTFLTGNLVEVDLKSADMTIALDVLIHISSLESYKALIRRIIALTNKCAVISGYESKPRRKSNITFYHEPLSISIRAMGNLPFIQMGHYNQVVIYRINK